MIPRIFHHVWPCDEEPFDRPKFVEWRESLRTLHPGWELRLWRPGDLLAIPGLLEDTRTILFDNGLPVYVKSDSMRWEVVRLFGGMYLDTDMECILYMDPFFNLDHFFVVDGRKIVFSQIFGAKPDDHVVTEVSKEVAKYILKNRDVYAYGTHQSLNPLIGEIVFASGCKLQPAWIVLDGNMNSKEQDARRAKAFVINHNSGAWPDGWQHARKYGITRKQD